MTSRLFLTLIVLFAHVLDIESAFAQVGEPTQVQREKAAIVFQMLARSAVVFEGELLRAEQEMVRISTDQPKAKQLFCDHVSGMRSASLGLTPPIAMTLSSRFELSDVVPRDVLDHASDLRSRLELNVLDLWSHCGVDAADLDSAKEALEIVRASFNDIKIIFDGEAEDNNAALSVSVRK